MLLERRPLRFMEAPRISPIFEPSPPSFPMRVSTTAQMMPMADDVIEAIIKAIRGAELGNERVVAILLGARWYAALDDPRLTHIRGWGFRGEPIRVLVDTEMERGVRLIYEHDQALNRWISKHIAADEQRVTIPVAELAAKAPEDDAALSVLADWFEANGKLEEATALRAAQRGFQLLAMLRQSKAHDDT